MKPWQASLIVAALSLLGLAGCGTETGSLTQIVVTVDSDLDVPDEIDSLEIRVGGKGMAKPATADLTKNDTPRTLSLVHDSGPLGPVTILARGLRNEAIVVEQTAEVYFVEGKTLQVALNLLQVCRGITCPADATCSDGDCVPTDSFQPGLDGGFATGGDNGAQDAGNGDDPDGGMSNGGTDGGSTNGANTGNTSDPLDASGGTGDAPACMIAFPAMGDAYQINQPASLSGSCSDKESGPITDDAYWTSDLQSGNLALGVVASGTFTQPGTHTLRLCAKDPADSSRVGCASGVLVTVTTTAQPTATIGSISQTSGGPPFVTGGPISLTGTGTGAGINLSWSDSLSGSMTGDTSASLSLPLLGKHVVRLTATDRSDKAVSAVQSFVVLAPGETSLAEPFTGANPTLGNIDTVFVSSTGTGYAASGDGKLYQFDPTALASPATVVLDSVQLPGKVKDGAIDAGLSAVYLATASGLVRCTYTAAAGIVASECTSYKTTTQNSDLPSDNILSVARMEGSNRQQYVIVGTSNGLLRSTPASPAAGADRLAGVLIHDIAVDQAARVAWLATSDGLYRYDPTSGAVPAKITGSGQPSATLRSVALGSEGAVWVASNAGLGRWNPSVASWTVWTTDNGLISNDARAVAISRPTIGGVTRDVIWVGTEAGVSRLDLSIQPLSFMSLLATDGLPSAQINEIVVMSDGAKLVATSAGIARYVGL